MRWAAVFAIVAVVLSTHSITDAINCPAYPQAFEISGSVRMYTNMDYQYNCHSMLERIRRVGGGTRVNFIVTHFWADADANNVPSSFCYRVGQVCNAPTQQMIARFEASFARCVSKAVALGFTEIWVTPHMDDKVGELWRNLLHLDPYRAFQGQSYWDIMLGPISRVLNTAAGPNVRLYVSIQGEMNAALINFPAQWTRAMAEMRTAVTAAGGFPAANLKVGVNNNFNKICAECSADANFAPTPGMFDLAAIAALYDAADFVALSAYASQVTNIKFFNLDASINVFAKELQAFGLNLTQLVASGKQLHYTEFGLGGARSSTGLLAARTPAEVAVTPFYGIRGGYNAALDPWNLPDNLAWSQFYYRLATLFARTGGTARWKVSSLFVWNYASYDMTGIHPISSSRAGTYQDRNTTNLINAYNTRCEVAATA